MELSRARMLGAEALELRVEQSSQPRAVDSRAYRFQSGLHPWRTIT